MPAVAPPEPPAVGKLLKATSWNIDREQPRGPGGVEDDENLRELLQYYKQRVEDREAANHEDECQAEDEGDGRRGVELGVADDHRATVTCGH